MLEDSLFLRTVRGTKSARPPIWFMRQAGRYLPEYRELRAKHSMLEVIMTPELAREVTLQPLRRFDFDASIIFADILTPLIGMGIELDFVKGEGPKIFNPITSHDDVSRLKTPPAAENTPYTLEAVQLVSGELNQRNIPLLGFSGAPFTLSSYMIEGGAHKLEATRRFMFQQPQAWAELQEKLVTVIAEYLVAQVKSGASALQLFDSWVGFLGPVEFQRFVAPYITKIIGTVKAQVTAPLIYFGTGTSGLFPFFRELGADAYGVDWRVSLGEAERLLERTFPLQGNLDPIVLAYADRDYLRTEVERVLSEGKALTAPHIFNLGHGILPETPIENVELVLEIVKSWEG